eukprot:XP_001692171.1 predicted protein [Chlamydomonas reinhardtii]
MTTSQGEALLAKYLHDSLRTIEQTVRKAAPAGAPAGALPRSISTGRADGRRAATEVLLPRGTTRSLAPVAAAAAAAAAAANATRRDLDYTMGRPQAQVVMTQARKQQQQQLGSSGSPQQQQQHLTAAVQMHRQLNLAYGSPGAAAGHTRSEARVPAITDRYAQSMSQSELILSSRESSSWQLAYEPLRQPSSAAWPTHPVPADCPRCRGRVVTLVTREAGMGTWTAAGGLALAGCVLGCCLLPFAWDTCKDATHTCPECGCELGKRVTDQVTKQQKTIISNMYGMAQPGRLLAIMGPSGAGKSTLLDVLACNTSSRGASLAGRITVDGAPRSGRQFAGISCYVQQKDVLLSSATVREVVHTAALLKLPYRGMSAAEKRELVEATLKELDLTTCADTLIGDETIGLKGISGGQKRRVSVGIELVKDPRVLFLDEPSSGLDSEMAAGVMNSLVRLAQKGRTVVCTIHQPNSDITDCFHDFLLLAGGRTIPVMLASELVQYVFVALFIGLMYYKFNDVLGEGDFNRQACIWFSFAVLCFTPSYTAVTNWTSERLLLKRELDQRLYGINTYYLARYAVLLPFEMAQCALFLCVMYFFVGFYPSASNFFIFFAVLSMFQIISEGLGACCAVVTRTPTSAIILLTFVLLVLLSFSGFLTVKTPVYFVWVQKLSYFTYAFSALLDTEFAKISFVDPATGDTVPGLEVLPDSVATGLSPAQNIGVVAAQLGGMELIKLTALHLAHRLNWL